MSWLSDLSDSIGSIFGGSASNIGPVANGSDYASMLGSVIPNITGQSDGSIWNNGNFLGSLLSAGTGLAGSYFQQSGQSSLASQYAQQAADQLAAEKEMKLKELENSRAIAGIYAGASKAGAAAQVAAANVAAQAQKKNTLANMYNNWAALTEKGGEAQMQGALGTGKTVSDAISTRSGVLR